MTRNPKPARSPSPLRIARFVGWFLWPVAVVVAAMIAQGILGGPLNNGGVPTEGQVWAALGVLLCVAVQVVFAVWMLVHIFKVLGMLRRRAGWYTKQEKTAAATDEAYRAGLERAATLKAALTAGSQPHLLHVWDVMLEPDEAVLMDVPLQYGRWYGTDASYMHSTTVVAGRTSFVVGSLVGSAIGSAIGNAARRSAALAAAQPMWREHQNVRTIVTDRRIMCWTTARGWMNFWYSDVTAAYPDPAGSTMILDFGSCEALRLHGYDGASLCIFAIATLNGRQALKHHPALANMPGLPS